ncbi:MAG: SpaH/EbpB family LPXTG-anchored major pilin [Propionibacteriaceae bacterium]|nr:SpaH/EbpB family LPXTG-anchored major pilin [Propionibacteriaceae bacterium]
MSRRKYRVAAAAVSACALAFMGLGAQSALADTGDPYQVDGVSQEAANKALINPDATVRLEIHKYLGAPTGNPNNGTEQTISGRDALRGVPFDVYAVGGVDLTTNDGWKAATALSTYKVTASDIAAQKITVDGVDYQLELKATAVTGALGVASFTGGVGLYLVVENLDKATAITDLGTGNEVAKASLTPSAPFLVTLPMTNPDDTSRWMYDVDVYPKNQTDTAVKEVEDKGTVTSDDGNVGEHGIDYTLTTSITDGSDPLGMYVIYDDLHESLTLDTAVVSLTSGPALVAGTDYNVYTAPDRYGTRTLFVSGTTAPVAGGPFVHIIFTDAGLAKLEANRDASVVTKLGTTLDEQDEDGVVENQGSFIPNESWWDQNGNPKVDPEDPTNPGDPEDPDNPDEPGIPTNPVESKYGNVVVNKADPADSGADMSGAEFAIYLDPTPGDGVCSADDVTGTPIATKTIAAGNTLTFVGLQASNWYDGKEIADASDWLSYCLVETKAPTGYNLDARPYYITIDYTTGTATAPAFTTGVVYNEKSNLDNELPLTGGEGVATLSVLGLVLVGGGVGYYALTSRRRREAGSVR